jgi:hypothetical protein
MCIACVTSGGTLGKTYDLNNTELLPTLCLQVFHKGSAFSSDQPLGIVEIPLDTIDPSGNPQHGWYSLQMSGRMQHVSGELHLMTKYSGHATTPPVVKASMSFGLEDVIVDMPDDAEDPDYVNEPPNELKVTVIRGRNLIIMDPNLIGRGGTSDPMVKLRVDGFKTQKSNVIKKNLNPVWNETLTFEYLEDPSLSLEVDVEDEDLVKNDFMGKVVIPLRSFENKKAVRKWYKLKDDNNNIDSLERGEVELIVWWHFNVDLKLRPKPTSFFSGVSNQLSSVGHLLRESDDEEEEDGQEPSEPPEMSEADAEKAKKEKEEAEAALKKELGDIEVKSGDYQVSITLYFRTRLMFT